MLNFLMNFSDFLFEKRNSNKFLEIQKTFVFVYLLCFLALFDFLRSQKIKNLFCFKLLCLNFLEQDFDFF